MTIKDLAQKTGYAVGTVSRALNNHPNVSEKAREEILRAAARYGFRLNENAQRLKQTRSNTILGIVKGKRNELFAQMVEEIQRIVAGTSYQLSIDYMDEDDNEVQRAEALAGQRLLRAGAEAAAHPEAPGHPVPGGQQPPFPGGLCRCSGTGGGHHQRHCGACHREPVQRHHRRCAGGRSCHGYPD